MVDQVEPCPFCGGAGRVETSRLSALSWPMWQHTPQCPVNAAQTYLNPEAAAKAGNTRTPAEPLADGEMTDQAAIYAWEAASSRMAGCFRLWNEVPEAEKSEWRAIAQAVAAYNPNERLTDDGPANHGYYLGKTGEEVPDSEAIVELVSDLRDPWQRFPHSERERIAEILIALNNRAYANERLREALEALVNKLDECEAPLRNIMSVYYAHGHVYNGPSYFNELEQARAALSHKD